MKPLYSILVVLFIVGCKNSSDTKDSTIPNTSVEEPVNTPIETSPEYDDAGSGTKQYDYQEFKDCYRDFFVAVLDDNESKFNTFINSTYGLYIIDGKDNAPIITNVADVSVYHKINGKSILSIGKINIGFELIEEDLPEVNCDEPTGYDFNGCYTANTNRLIASEVWKSTGMNKDDQSDFVSLAETVAKTVVNTANYTYYFSFVDGSWYLTFLDVRKPCDA